MRCWYWVFVVLNLYDEKGWKMSCTLVEQKLVYIYLGLYHRFAVSIFFFLILDFIDHTKVLMWDLWPSVCLLGGSYILVTQNFLWAERRLIPCQFTRFGWCPTAVIISRMTQQPINVLLPPLAATPLSATAMIKFFLEYVSLYSREKKLTPYKITISLEPSCEGCDDISLDLILHKESKTWPKIEPRHILLDAAH